MERVVTSWDDSPVIALDGDDMVGRVRRTQFAKGHVKDVGALAQFDTHHNQGSFVDFPILAHPRVLEPFQYLLGCKHLGIDERVDSHLMEYLLILREHVLGIIYAGDGLLGSQRVGKHTAGDVSCLVGRHGNEEIGVSHACLLHAGNTARGGVNSHEVVIA